MTGKILVLNLPGDVLKAGSRWYSVVKRGPATLRYYPYPWFMGYLTSLLKKNGFNVVFKDAMAQEWSTEETRDYVADLQPTHIVCEPTWVSADTDRAFLNALGSDIVKIGVGNFATNFPLRCLEVGVELAVVGEYEFALLDYFKKGGESLPACFVGADKHDYTPAELIQDLDQFPFPERDDVPIRAYNEPSCYGVNVVMVSSRGCRLRCGFCNVEAVYGCHSFRVRSARNVVDEMVHLRANYEFDEIYFDDDNMISRPSHVDGICNELISRNVDIPWLGYGDALVKDESLELMARAGCRTYKYGVEHLDPDVLRAIPKPLNPTRSLEIIKKCRELGMRSYVNLIVGLPESTEAKDLDMLQRVISAGPDLLQIGIATPYPGTEFYRQSCEQNWLVKGEHDGVVFDVTGDSSVSYPDYPADRISAVFHRGWQMWYWHVLLHQPSSLLFFVRSELKREGVWSTLRKVVAYASKVVSGK